jgi:uncharacterized SAM-binding protein YcdF (DUF218 family)
LEEDPLMFFILSKTVAFLFLPSNLFILLGLVGLVLMTTRRKRAGVCMAAASIVMLAAAGFLPVGNLLTHPLESRFPPWDSARGAPDGIIVLGGAISSELSRAHGEPVVDSNPGRIIAMAKLARAFPDARIVYSGGDASLFHNRLSEADFVYPLLDSLGVPRERVLLESRSRNTAENAAFTKDLLKPKPDQRWLLVTSAQHMPRAVGCFRRVGFPVEAYPVDWHLDEKLDWMVRGVNAPGLARLDSAAYEWIGLFAYWLTGKTAEIFPAP